MIAGGDNNLAVIMGAYEPMVQCKGVISSWKSCKDIMYDMPAFTNDEIFGPPTDPSAAIHLPQQVESGRSLQFEDFDLSS